MGITTILLLVLILILVGVLPARRLARSWDYVLGVAPPGDARPPSQLSLIWWLLAGAAVTALVIAHVASA
jgi:hypothetical protein